MIITIHPELKKLMRQLTPEEVASLERSISSHGFRDPLVVWQQDGKSILLDGHHRYQIAEKHNISFHTVQVELPDLDAAKAWIIQNQLGRRNLTPNEASYYRGLEYLHANRKQGNRADLTSGQNVPKLRTSEKIAKARGVDEKTIRRDAEFANAVDNLAATLGDEVRNRALRRADHWNKSDVLKLAQVAAKNPAVARRAFELVATDEEPKVPYAITKARRESARADAQARGASVRLPDRVQVVQGDFRQVLSEMAADSVDLIFTDPPYAKEFLPLYGDLARHAARVLKPGGILIAYVGTYALPQLLASMDAHLDYWWQFIVLHNGKHQSLPGAQVHVGYKPLLAFSKGQPNPRRDYVNDVFRESTQPDKLLHDWAQSDTEAAYFIEHLTAPNDIVCDPFVGSGTTLVATERLGRRGIGGDIDQDCVLRARARLSEVIGASGVSVPAASV